MSSVLYKWWPFASRPCIFFFYLLVPDYLRTKYDPEIEDAEQRLETMATSIPADHAQVKQTKCKKVTVTFVELYRTLVTRTLKRNEKQFELLGVQVIWVDWILNLYLKNEMTIELCVYVDVLHIFQFIGSIHFDGASLNIRSSQFL